MTLDDAAYEWAVHTVQYGGTKEPYSYHSYISLSCLLWRNGTLHTFPARAAYTLCRHLPVIIPDKG